MWSSAAAVSLLRRSKKMIVVCWLFTLGKYKTGPKVVYNKYNNRNHLYDDYDDNYYYYYYYYFRVSLFASLNCSQCLMCFVRSEAIHNKYWLAERLRLNSIVNYLPLLLFQQHNNKTRRKGTQRERERDRIDRYGEESWTRDSQTLHQTTHSYNYNHHTLKGRGTQHSKREEKHTSLLITF